MRVAWFLVQGWSNFRVIVNEFCCPTELLVPIWGQWKQQLVIHNYCQSQISFPGAPGVHFCPSNNTEGIPEAWSPTLLTIQSERWFWSSRRYIRTTNIYEWKSVVAFISSVRSSYSHPDLLLIHHPPHPTFSDHTGPQHWTFTFWATTAI